MLCRYRIHLADLGEVGDRKSPLREEGKKKKEDILPKGSCWWDLERSADIEMPFYGNHDPGSLSRVETRLSPLSRNDALPFPFVPPFPMLNP